MTAAVEDTRVVHPMVAAIEAISAAADDVVEQRAWSMTTADCHRALEELARVANKLAAVEDSVVVQAEAMEPRETAGHWARLTRRSQAECRARVRVAVLTDQAHHAVRGAMAVGGVAPDQARVIVEAVEQLRDRPEHQPACEAHLVGLARHHDAAQLRILGRRVLEVVDPSAAEAHEARLLAEQEARAQAAARCTMHHDGHGQVHGRFTLPELHGELLRRALDGLAAPGHVRAVGEEWTVDRPTPERLGQALCDYVEHYSPSTLPETVSLVVTCTVEDLRAAFVRGVDRPGGHGPGATTDDGQRLSPGELRRLACTHGVLPAVMGGRSEVLDLGRRARLATRRHRTALAVSQRHCQHAGCDVPARFCHVHHRRPWSHGGPSDLDNLELRCPRHHRAVHAETGPTPPLRR